MRVVFFGSPDFALPTLEALLSAGHAVGLVVAQPAKPAGRRQELRDPPVALRARVLGVPVFQPPSLKADEVAGRLREEQADVFVVAAYGRILPQVILDLPRLGCLNVHGSLLPRWRGASPVQAAILAGDMETGVSIMRMDPGMDTGPVYARRATRIADGETAGELSARLAEMGAVLLLETMEMMKPRGTRATRDFLEGGNQRAPAGGRATAGTSSVAPSPSKQVLSASVSIPPIPQDEPCATYCPKITREDGRVDWRLPAATLARRDRAFTPWPGLFTSRRNTRVKLSGLSPVSLAGPASGAAPTPGTVLEASSCLVIACGEGTVAIASLQAEGRRLLPAGQFVRGERVAAGEVWGSSPA